jgi:protein gp37
VGDKTGIEWTDATWNPVTGCSKVSQGCRNCYALRDWARLSANKGSVYFGRAFTDVQCHADRLGIPLEWKRPRRIFVNSMSDLFHASVPDTFIARVLETIEEARQHTFQVLTKRPERMWAFFNARGSRPPDNCQIGTSVEDQFSWLERAPWLLLTEARVRFVSFEPLLGPVDCSAGWHEFRVKFPQVSPSDGPLSGIQWAIVGGESGPAARPMHPAWVRALRDQCELAGVPFFFKQWGEWAPGENCGDPPLRTEKTASWFADRWNFGELTPRQSAETHREDEPDLYRCGKKRAGRMLDGVVHDAQPDVLPNVRPGAAK